MIAVVVGEELMRSFSLLLRRIEGTARQARGVDFFARDIPVNLLHRDVVGDPGLHPAIEAGHDGLVGIVGIARRQRLEAVQSMKIANRPWNERSKASMPATSRPARIIAGETAAGRLRSPARPQAAHEQPKEIAANRSQQDSAIGTQQNGGADRQSATDPCAGAGGLAMFANAQTAGTRRSNASAVKKISSVSVRAAAA